MSDYENIYGDEIGFSLKKIAKAVKRLGGGKKKPASFKKVSEGIQRVPLGFPAHQFLPGDPTSKTLTVNPQKPFLPRRLIISEKRTGATGIQVLVTSFRIGTEEMLAGSGAIPVEAFAAGAFETLLQTKQAVPGVEISLRVELSNALANGEQITVSAVMLGDAVRD